MTPPKRYLSSTEVGEKLGGLSDRAVNQRRGRARAGAFAADVVIGKGRASVYGWDPARPDLTPDAAPPARPGPKPDRKRQRKIALAYLAGGVTYAEVGKRFRISGTQVQRIVKAYKLSEEEKSDGVE